MYKILLVDDEVLTREVISKNIPWEEAGFQLIGAAENGKEAVNLIEKEQPHVVLTDICMPIMDGIALSSYIHENYSEIIVIIISGYDDFEFAKQAIKNEVSNYILKPITSFELLAELERVKTKIDDSLKKQSELESTQYKLRKNLETIRNHFLNKLLEGSYIKNDIELQMQQLNIRLSGKFQTVVMLEVVDISEFWEYHPAKKEELIDFSVANISEEIAEGYSNVIFFKNTERKSILVFADENENELLNLLQKVCRKIANSIYQNLKIRICTLVGQTVQSNKSWRISYQSVLEAKERRFFLEDKEFIYGTDHSGQKEEVPLLVTQQVDKLLFMIKMNQRADIENITIHIFNSLRNSGKEKKQLLITIQNFVLSILISLEEHIPDRNEKYGEEFMLQISTYKHLRDAEQWFLEFCTSLANEIAQKREHVNQKQAVRAMNYLEKNYMNENMSLNMICDYLNVSTSYFSMFFKSATGETFVEALTRIRIRKAKHLFEGTNMKNYEVALLVGYQDPHYFSSIFKKHVGMTPSEYAKRLRKGSEQS